MLEPALARSRLSKHRRRILAGDTMVKRPSQRRPVLYVRASIL